MVGNYLNFAKEIQASCFSIEKNLFLGTLMPFTHPVEMLRPATYIIIDCETTGLDTINDEPIQIGLVQFDHTFTIQATYSSYIRPTYPEKELAEIVQSIT